MMPCTSSGVAPCGEGGEAGEVGEEEGDLAPFALECGTGVEDLLGAVPGRVGRGADANAFARVALNRLVRVGHRFPNRSLVGSELLAGVIVRKVVDGPTLAVIEDPVYCHFRRVGFDPFETALRERSSAHLQLHWSSLSDAGEWGSE
jgi:hypothetical protein